MERVELKEIGAKTTVKAIITGFVSYGIIAVFIFLLIFAIGNHFLSHFSETAANGLYVTIPLLASIMLYFIIHLICRISTYDVLKKCKVNPKHYSTIVKSLNIFFIICIILCIITFLSLLYLNLEYQLKSIELASIKYKEVFSENHIKILRSKMNSTFESSKINLTKSTVILVIGLSLSFLSLIPYQRKMILEYNKYETTKNKN